MFRKLGLSGALLLVPLVLWAAVTPNAPITPQTPKHYLVRFVQGTDSAATYKTLVTGGANGTRCMAVWMTTDDTTATHIMTFRITRSATPYQGPIATTNLTQLPVGILNSTLWPGLPTDSDGNSYLHLEPSDLLEVTFATALTAAKIIAVHAECWDF